MSRVASLPARVSALIRGTLAEIRAPFWAGHSILREMEAWAADDPGAPFLWFRGRTWSVSEANAAANAHAAAFRAAGLSPGDRAALLYPNHPEALFAFWGAVKAGLVPALVDLGLRGDRLRRALEQVEPTIAIAASSLVDALAEIIPRLCPPSGAFAHSFEGTKTSALPAWTPIAGANNPSGPPPNPSTVMALVFTSGTTGVPKPAVIRHLRFSRSGAVMGRFLRIASGDVIYAQAPLARANVLVLATSVAICRRAKLAIGTPDSSRYWEEANAAGATIGVYGGHLASELFDRPPAPADHGHAIQRMVGDGLRPALWSAFTRRFGIDEVFELYGCTEGNAHTVNLLNTKGSCGLLLPGLALARWDPESEDLVRGADGFVEHAPPGEPGLILGSIGANDDFAGYRSLTMTERRVRCDVFQRGDRWFDGGDLLIRDRLRRLFYQGRVGETYERDQERFSTEPLLRALSAVPGVLERTVFTTTLTGSAQRVAVAAVRLERELDVESLYGRLADLLPEGALPYAIRVVTKAPLKKSVVQAEGLDCPRERLFFRDVQLRNGLPSSVAALSAFGDA